MEPKHSSVPLRRGQTWDRHMPDGRRIRVVVNYISSDDVQVKTEDNMLRYMSIDSLRRLYTPCEAV